MVESAKPISQKKVRTQDTPADLWDVYPLVRTSKDQQAEKPTPKVTPKPNTPPGSLDGRGPSAHSNLKPKTSTPSTGVIPPKTVMAPTSSDPAKGPTSQPTPLVVGPEFTRLVKRYGHLKDRIKEMEMRGIDLEDLIQAFKAAQPLLKKKEFATADRLADEIEGQLNDIHKTYLEYVSRHETLLLRLSQANEMGLDLKDIEVIKGDAEKAVKGGDLKMGSERTSFCIETIEAAQKEVVNKLLGNVSLTIREASHFIDISRPTDLINQGNIALTRGQYYKAYNLLKASQEELVNIQERCQSVLEKMKRFSSVVDAATEIGFRIHNSKIIIEKGKSLLKEGRVEVAKRYIEEELRVIENEVERYISNRWDKAKGDLGGLKERLKEAKKSKADTNKMESDLKMVEALLSVRPTLGQLEEASKILNDVRSALDMVLSRAVEEKEQIKRLESLLPDLLDMLIETSESYDVHQLEKLYANAKSSRDMGNIQGALEYTSQFSELLREIKSNSHPQISLELGADELEPEIWSRLICQMENVGTTTAVDIDLDLSGPITIKRVRTIDSLKIGKKVSFEVGAVLNGRGRLPVDVELRYLRHSDKKAYIYNEEIWLLVGMGGKGKDTRMKVGPTYSCEKCQGPIKEDDVLVKCECLKPYHSQCAKQARSCSSCGARISDASPVVRSFKRPRPGEIEDIGEESKATYSKEQIARGGDDMELDGEWL